MKHFDLEIKLDGLTDLWGKYTLVFPVCSTESSNDGLLPYNSEIKEVNLKVYIGSVDEKTNINDSVLIQGIISDNPKVVSPNLVTFFLKHPGENYSNIKATLVIEITLMNEGKKTFYGSFIYIGWSG